MKSKAVDLLGQRFGLLTVVARDGTDKRGHATWRCQCDCGDETVVRSSALIHGETNSCGCSKRKKASIADAVEKPCTGITCNQAKCSATCGWHPKEQAKRKRMISSGAMKQGKDGHYGLVIKRRKTNVNAD